MNKIITIILLFSLVMCDNLVENEINKIKDGYYIDKIPNNINGIASDNPELLFLKGLLEIDGKKSKPANIINNINLRGITFFGPAFFNEVFFQPMQRMDPSQEQMKGVIKRLRRFNLREETFVFTFKSLK